MKPITRFLADDGAEFASELEALERDALVAELIEVEKHLIPRPSGGHFTESGEYVQQSGPVVLAFQRRLIRMFATRYDAHLGERWARYLVIEVPVGNTYLGRLVSDCAPPCFNRTWWRLWCMDRRFREYGQPYFAHQADKALDSALKMNGVLF